MARRMAKSVRALATAVGRSHTAVERWLRHPAWDLPRQPPWDVEHVRDWAARNLGPDPAKSWTQASQPAAGLGSGAGNGGGGNGGGVSLDGFEALRRHPIQAAKLKLTVVRASKLELERAILAGEFVPRADIEEAFVRRVHAARAAFQSLPRQLAGQLVGLSDEVQIEQILDDAIRGVLLELSQRPALPPLRDTEVIR